jgi:serine/threonine protein kinase
LPQGQEIAVIADFNASYSENDFEEKLKTRTAACWCAPELGYAYLHPEMSVQDLLSRLTQAIDVWSMGLILYMLYYEQFFPWMELKEDNQFYEHLVQLKEDWLPLHPGTEFIAPLLKKMLEPNVKNRCTSAEAFALFKPIYQRMSHDALS